MWSAHARPDPPGRPRPETATSRGAASAGCSSPATPRRRFSADADPIHTDETGLIIETVTLPSSGFDPAGLCRPARRRAGRFPAVLVVSEVFGLHDYIRDVCRRLAKLGYVAIAPAFFVRVGDPAPLTDFAAVIKIVGRPSDPQVMGDVGATLTFLRAQPFVADMRKMAITGFCWGGGITWLACESLPGLQGRASPGTGAMAPPPGARRDPSRLWPIEHGRQPARARCSASTAARTRLAQASRRCARRWPRPARPTARSSSTRTPATASTPTTAPATTPPTPPTAGRGCWPSSPRNGVAPRPFQFA